MRHGWISHGLLAHSWVRVHSAKADYGAPYTLECVLIAILGGVDSNGRFGKMPPVRVRVQDFYSPMHAVCQKEYERRSSLSAMAALRSGDEQPVVDFDSWFG